MKISDQSEKRGSEEATKPNTLPELIIKTELIYGIFYRNYKLEKSFLKVYIGISRKKLSHPQRTL